MRVIQYERLELEVPDWANYISANSEGEVSVFKDEPVLFCLGVWDWLASGRFLWVGTLPKKESGYPCIQLYPEPYVKPPPKETLAEFKRELSVCYDNISFYEKKAQELREIITTMEEWDEE